MYDYLFELLEQNNISKDSFLFDQPALLDVLCNVKQATGEVVAPAFYHISLWPKLRDLPILTHAMASYKKRGTPDCGPRLSYLMRNKEENTLYISTMEEVELIAPDIPLCSYDHVISNLSKKIEDGHIQKVFSLRFGYALYNNPNMSSQEIAAFDADYFYAVPSWVIECVYMVNPKETHTYSYEESLEYDPDTSERSALNVKTITIDAQTGKMLEPTDTSKKGFGNADFQGFIPWEKIS